MEKVAEKILNLAVQYAFQITGTNAEQLNVFNENALVKQGYEKVGFVERNMDKDDKNVVIYGKTISSLPLIFCQTNHSCIFVR